MNAKCGLFFAICLFGVTVVGCGHSLERRMEEYQRRQLRAADVLRNRSESDSLAAAALFTMRGDPADALVLILRATSAAPDRPELTWLHARICAESAGCDPHSIETLLQRLDPRNGLGWFGSVARAYDAGDDAALDAALAAVGRSRHVDSYFTTLVARMSEATANAGALPLSDAIVAVTGEIAAFALPELRLASKGCAADRLQRPSRLEACRSLAKSLMAGDTHLTEMIGVAIAKRVWPVDSPNWQAAMDARRTYRYRSAALFNLEETRDWDETVAANFLGLLERHRREQDVTAAQLVAHDIDLAPPENWHDEQLQ